LPKSITNYLMMRRVPRSVPSVGLAVGLAFYVALLELGAEFVIRPPQAVYDFWHSPGPILIGVCAAVALGAVVRHFAVLAVAAIPIAIQASLDAVGFVRPWHEIAPTVNPGWPMTATVALALSLGLLVGAARDAACRYRAALKRA
jgi:hypothetical protein